MKIAAALLFVSFGCASRPVTITQWNDCFAACMPLSLLEACDHLWEGRGCKCSDGEVIWLDNLED